MSDQYYELTFSTNQKQADMLGEWLFNQSGLSFSIEDLNEGSNMETPIYSEGVDTASKLWSNCLLKIFIPQNINKNALLEKLQDEFSFFQSLKYKLSKLQDVDWEKHNKEQFKPIKISNNMWIVPTWHKPPNSKAKNIYIDPGIAFGTGMHETTKLCLTWLDKHIKGGETVCDYGCGSGILGIAALKLGAKASFGIDIDKQAVCAARDNAKKNGVNFKVFDSVNNFIIRPNVIVANILFKPLKQLAPEFFKILKPNGYIVLSGILTEQVKAIQKIYSEYFVLRKPLISNEWCCVYGKKIK